MEFERCFEGLAACIKFDVHLQRFLHVRVRAFSRIFHISFSCVCVYSLNGERITHSRVPSSVRATKRARERVYIVVRFSSLSLILVAPGASSDPP